ncbi:type IV pilin protein [Enterovibrio baiacu]|uniref:type IV pilin protein n=1 Tax=Enterovibrio baiacu TaxID=2491023 RepID=UPI001F0B8FF2|nr:type IV pilin protein [Enterovibrio baiacu]
MDRGIKTLQLGMTLIEILVAIAIIGALTSIAVPAFSNYLIQAERSRVQTDLYQLQVWVEQQYTAKSVYPSEIKCTRCQVSDEYTFTIDIDKSGTGNDVYKIKATPKSTSNQKNDTDCYTMIINAASEQSNKSKDGTTLDSSKCWV